MLLDQVTPSSETVADQFTGLSPGAKDELAYLVLVGLIGTVPDSLIPGKFCVGQLSLRYEWHNEAPVGGTVVAQSGNLKLILMDGAHLLDNASIPMCSILKIWKFIQEHSDAIAFWPSSERRRWISSTAQEFSASEEFVLNLAANYPKIRRICS